MREDRQTRPDVRLRHRREHLPLIVCENAALLSDFAEGAKPLRLRIAHEIVGNLLGGLRRDLGRIVALHVVAAAGDNGHARFGGDSRQRREIAIHVRMPAVDDAADAVRGSGLRFFNHQVDIICEGRGHRAALGRGERLRQRIPDRQVFVEQRRAFDRIGCDVLQQGSDDGAARKRGRLRVQANAMERQKSTPGRCSQKSEGLSPAQPCHRRVFYPLEAALKGCATSVLRSSRTEGYS